MPNRYSIVAMNHCKSEDFVKNLPAGTVITLVREPNNKFDPNAVMVWVDSKHVGYIPKATNKVLAQFIDANGRDAGIDVAMDSATTVRSIVGKFVRSPNSGYPQVEV